MDALKNATYFAQHPLFKNLPEATLEHLAEIARPMTTARYQFVYLPDERADGIFILVAGHLKVGYFAPDGQEVIKELLNPGAMFGESVIFGEPLRPDYSQARHLETVCLEIPKADFLQVMADNFPFVTAFLDFMNRRMNRIETRLNSLILQDARQRIVHFLLESAGLDGRKIGYETLVQHHLTQQDIANLTGTSRQTVTSVLGELRKSNQIHFNRTSFLIRDLEKLG